jgi:hypothetical protein
MRPRIALVVALAAVPFAAGPVQAEAQSWNWVELRLPLTADQPGWPRTLRFEAQDNGLSLPTGGQLLFRLGPIWEPSPNLSFALNLSNAGDPGEGSSGAPETALEAEPTLHANWGGLSLAYRNRLESRWLAQGHRWRDRNQLRVNYRLPGTPWVPFAVDEGFYDLSAGAFTQNRATLGVGFQFGEAGRIDLGFMLRSLRAADGGWGTDPVAHLSIVLTPQVAPMF